MNQELPLTSPPDDDRAARRLAQTEFDRPLILEAGAGTGKTTTLVARIVSWCLGPGWQEQVADAAGSSEPTEDHRAAEVLRGVVAITFTESAAAEMASRVAEALAAFARDVASELRGIDLSVLPPTPKQELRQRALALLGALDQLRVQTIHAFCRGLLSAYPLDARLHPDLVVDADERRLEALVREVVEERIRSAYARQPRHPLTRLAALGWGAQSVVDAIRGLIAERGLRARELATDPLEAPRLEEIRARLLGVLAAFGEADRARLRSVQRGSAAPAMADALDRSTAAGESFAAGSIDQLERLLRELREIWTESLLGRLGRWARDVYTQAERQALEHRTEALSAAAEKLQGYLRHISRLDPRLLDLARRALGPLLLEVERRLRARGVATFQALLVEARDLLARRPPVRRRERRRIRQLLVDEFQDTDRLQCDLIRMLALQGQPSERPGLFVVGDPKQSIFGWRNADLEAYEEFVSQALESGGIRQSLTRNFRSAPPILQEVERAVEPVMIQETGLQPRFEPLVADRAGAPGFAQARWAPVEYWVSWLPPDAGDAAGPRPGANEIALLEARAIAEDIVALHDGQDVKWQQIGLLLRSMNQLETYLGALREADVPFAVARDKQYYRRREIIEAAALVRTVLNPLDHLALLTTLRSASVGVPDAALIPLWQEGFPGEITELAGPDDARLDRIRRIIESVVRRLPAGIPGLDRIRGWELNLQRAVLNLALLRESYRRQPSDRFLERLRQRWLLETTEAARYLGPYRVANLARFFRRLEVALEESGGDMQAILRALRRSVSEAQEAEEARPLEAAENAVQVLTIHRAKGLEFRHVYLVQLHARTRESATPWVDADERWAPDGPREYALFGSPTPDFDRVEERRRRVAVGERVRTLYVAMTRARDRLVLVGNWPETPRPVSLERATSHLDLLQRRRPLPDSFSELRDRCADQVSRRLDQHHARWRFLQHSTPGAPARSARAGAPATLPAPSEIEQAAQTLRNLRVEARQRMARPYVEAASARLGELRPKEPGRHAVAVGRDVALAVGRAVHRMLETWRFDAEPTGELARQRRLLHEGLERRLSGDLVAEALRRAEVLLARLEAGSMLDRLAALGPKVLGREVPVLLPGGEGDAGAVGCTVGVVDLLYRDSPAGRTVIVDYKTDDVTESGEIEARAEAYHPQIAVYRQAVQQALGLADPPEAELWFLLADRVWRSS